MTYGVELWGWKEKKEKIREIIMDYVYKMAFQTGFLCAKLFDFKKIRFIIKRSIKNRIGIKNCKI